MTALMSQLLNIMKLCLSSWLAPPFYGRGPDEVLRARIIVHVLLVNVELSTRVKHLLAMFPSLADLRTIVVPFSLESSLLEASKKKKTKRSNL